MAGNWHRIGDIKGRDGVGVPTGGARGDVLKKEGGTDFATSWGAVNYADIQGKVPASALPEIGTAPYVVASQDAMLNLPAVPGRQAIRTDIGATFVLAEEPASTLENWVEMVSRSDVTSVNGKTGSVELTKADVGLSEVNNTADSDKPEATQSVRGLMSPSDKKKLDDATHSATGNAIARRDGSGSAAFSSVSISNAPSSSEHAATKGYVDLEVEGIFGGTTFHDHVDTLTEPGVYSSNMSSSSSVENGHPEGTSGSRWSLFVLPVGGTLRQQVLVSNSKIFSRYTTTFNPYVWSAWRSTAEDVPATSSRDGLMPRADKALLDTAASSPTGGALMRRDVAGRVGVSAPTSTAQAANKGYVDAADEALDAKIDAEITRISGGDHTYADDFTAVPTRTRTVIVEGAPYGSPHAVADGKGFGFNGITQEQVWKVEEEVLGLGYATQRWTLVGANDNHTHMLGFSWERTWIPGRSQWTGYTCVAGDTGILISKAYRQGAANFEPGKPWRTRHATTSSTPANTTESLYNQGQWPEVRRIGPMVHVRAAFKPVFNSVANDIDVNRGAMLMSWVTRTCMRFWINDDAKGAFSAGAGEVQQGSSDNRWFANIINARSAGGRYEITAARYGPSSPTATTWLPLKMSWPAPVPEALTHANAADPDALPEPGDTGGEDDTAPDPEG